MAFTENMMEQHNVFTANILGSPGVNLGPIKYYEPGGNEVFPQYHVLVVSLMWLFVMTRP